ncbi:MAG: 4'-phosphopantetheinyl transferase superfamily protein [Candidatus Eremiobacteraeota bacterium]|nr:4'-phosphopantetheinyl transferase superfamily protein [Candidatus Eremiobacteraeota bacterium]
MVGSLEAGAPCMGVIAAAECHVWWADPLISGEDLARHLDDAERERAARFRRPEDRLRYAAAHGLARLVLGADLGEVPRKVRFETECARCGGPHGKPRLLGSGAAVDFSISHSGRRVVVAAARGVRVGVDVESTARRYASDEPLVRGVLTPAEAEALTRVPESRRAEAFFRYWTRKEAVLKATGDGLTVPPASVEVSGPDDPPHLLAWNAVPPLDAVVRLHDLSAGTGHCGVLALIGGPDLTIVERAFGDVLAGAR